MGIDLHPGPMVELQVIARIYCPWRWGLGLISASIRT